MKKILVGIILLVILGCGLGVMLRKNVLFKDNITTEENEEKIESNKEKKREITDEKKISMDESIQKGKKVELVNNEKIDTRGLIELDRMTVDLDSDGQMEEIIEMGRNGKMEVEDGLILIKDGNSLSVLSEGDLHIGVQEIIDIDKDGIHEILIDIRMGGNMFNQSSLYRYDEKKKEYIRVDTILPELEARLIDGYKIKVIEKNTMTYVEKNIKDTDIEKIKNRYDTLGKIIREDTQVIGYGSANVYDYNRDGKLEYTERIYIAGNAKAETLLVIDMIYKYDDGKATLLGILAENEERGKNTKIKKIEERSTEIPKKEENLSEHERRKKAVQVLYDREILDSKWDVAQIDEIVWEPFNRYKGRYYQVMASNVNPEEAHDHAMCYLVNKNDFSILIAWSNGETMTVEEFHKLINE